MHRVMVLLNRKGTDEVTHDEKMSLVWRMLRGTPVQHTNMEKPYTWAMEESGADTYTLTFSCIDPAITELFLKKAQETVNQAIQIERSFWIPVLAMPIQDIPYLQNVARIETQNGMICRHWYRYPTGRGRRTFYIRTDKEDFIAAVKRQLVRRAKLFSHKEFQTSDIQIKFLRLVNYGDVQYKGRQLHYQNVTFKIIAPKEIIELLVYGGAGSLTGSGFGMVLAA